ncbi:DUF3224 domain-containing protein [Actinomadura scrupuli]|uniref:DUF3224 domain-containing protein n=1 Tax=Actinomadura scrupuli TaxID=559629 RepID=UPI003D96E537
MSTHATGTFDIGSWDELSSEEEIGATLSRVRLTKTFQGDLAGTSVTDITTVATSAGPAAYVGIERFEGSLHGRKGAFVLQHSAGSEDGTPGTAWLRWVIVPTSGTGELSGVRGEGQIVNDDGAHSYTLDYEIG